MLMLHLNVYTLYRNAGVLFCCMEGKGTLSSKYSEPLEQCRHRDHAAGKVSFAFNQTEN